MSQSLDPNVDVATSHIGLEATNFQMAGHMLAIGIINDYHFKLLFFSCQSMSEQSEITWTIVHQLSLKTRSENASARSTRSTRSKV